VELDRHEIGTAPNGVSGGECRQAADRGHPAVQVNGKLVSDEGAGRRRRGKIGHGTPILRGND